VQHAQVESSAVQVKFFERAKGRVFHHPASVNFDCGRFESGWLVYTDMVETSKVSTPAALSSPARTTTPSIAYCLR
jgi:Oligonucleotide/oligosaccharide-binding (OB)-fold